MDSKLTTASLRSQLANLGFDEVVVGRRQLYLTHKLAEQAQSIDRHLTELYPYKADGAGNRHSAVALTVGDLPPMFVRRSRRGGLMRLLSSELYAGFVPRQLHELVVNAIAHQRGLPVAEPLGAIIEALGPCFYRGWFLTRALAGVTLWNLLLSGSESDVRRRALEQARVSINRLHDGGLYHADLNLHNLFVCTGRTPFEVVVLDLDKARLYPAPLAQALQRRNFRRLNRSALKLIKAGGFFTPQEGALIGFGYG